MRGRSSQKTHFSEEQGSPIQKLPVKTLLICRWYFFGNMFCISRLAAEDRKRRSHKTHTALRLSNAWHDMHSSLLPMISHILWRKGSFRVYFFIWCVQTYRVLSVTSTRKVQETLDQRNFDLYCKEVEGVTGGKKKRWNDHGRIGKLAEAFIKLNEKAPCGQGAGQMNKPLKINLANYCLSHFQTATLGSAHNQNGQMQRKEEGGEWQLHVWVIITTSGMNWGAS